jgi:glycosyltransferase involved in cell wall biosynthesis
MDVERYLAAYDVLVHPSYREGFGMVLQEAGAMGVPYITTNIPGPKEIGINGVTGLLVEPQSVTDLEDKIRQLINNLNLIKEMSESMYNLTLDRYERSKMVQRIYEHRLSLINKYHIIK